MADNITSDDHNEIKASQSKIVLVVKKQHIKTVKTALERCGTLDKSTKIILDTQEHGDSPGPTDFAKRLEEQRMRIPTTISYSLNERGIDPVPAGHDMSEMKAEILQELDLKSLYDDISISYHTPVATMSTTARRNPLHKALQVALSDLPKHDVATLIDAIPEGYSIYNPLLLLPHSTFASEPWKSFLLSYPSTHPYFQAVCRQLAKATGTTHVAINSPIPAQNPGEGENILRSPLNMTPLQGNFGPSPTPQTSKSPTKDDFHQAFWVNTIQNGIHQTWAPLYTMFSRGNIKEKTRILRLPGVESDSTAVDMYAGIGYFSFSYKKAGVGKVICFELNPWSVEGLRRGAEMNHWACKIVKEDELGVWKEGNMRVDGDVDFLIFQMSNEYALPILTWLRASIPPIRHVNLGLLPDARAAWRDAVRLVDGEEGGCVRVHENVGVAEIAERKSEVERVCHEYLSEEGKSERKMEVEHVERVKMYAPGVVHCVFDVHMQGRRHVG